jgi:hypothetical protein
VPTPQTTAYLDLQHAHLYKSHSLDNSYDIVGGRFALPVAENPTDDPSWSPVVVVQAHAPYQRRTVVFQTTKESAPPTIPSPEDTGAFTFLTGNIFFHGPRTQPSGNGFNWHVEGAYEYIVGARSDPDDGFVLGSLPVPNRVEELLKSEVSGPTPVYGAVAQSGPNVRVGYAEAGNVNRVSPAYAYICPSYFPPTSLNTGMVDGTGQIPPIF